MWYRFWDNLDKLPVGGMVDGVIIAVAIVIILRWAADFLTREDK